MTDPLASDLDAWMVGDLYPDDLTDTADWADGHPATADMANMVLRRVTCAKAEQAAIEALAAAEIERVRAWAADRCHGPKRVIEQAETALEGYARAEHERSGGRVKTFHLPNGTLRLTAPRTSLVIDDETEVAAFLEEIGQRDLLKFTVRRVELKRAVQEMPMSEAETEGADPAKDLRIAVLDGAVIPGCHLESPKLPTFGWSLPAPMEADRETVTPT